MTVDIAANEIIETNTAELDEIRLTYIPELFLDYHNALYYTGHVLSGEILVQCMNTSSFIVVAFHRYFGNYSYRAMRVFPNIFSANSSPRVVL